MPSSQHHILAIQVKVWGCGKGVVKKKCTFIRYFAPPSLIKSESDRETPSVTTVRGLWSLAGRQTLSQNRAFDLFADSAWILIRLKVRTHVVPLEGIEHRPRAPFFFYFTEIYAFIMLTALVTRKMTYKISPSHIRHFRVPKEGAIDCECIRIFFTDQRQRSKPVRAIRLDAFRF